MFRAILSLAALTMFAACGVGTEPELFDDANSESGESELRATVAATISLDQADPHLGDRVTFTVTGLSRGQISVACYQGGLNLVWSANGDIASAFLLGGTDSTWLGTGGPALCYAWLYKRSLSQGFVASTRFSAQGAR